MSDWNEDYTEFKIHTLLLLKQHGKEIGEKSKEGNSLCKRIVENYALLYKSFDPLTHHLIKKDLEEYLNLEKNYFENHLNQASEIVKTWPEWKQNVLGKIKKGE